MTIIQYEWLQIQKTLTKEDFEKVQEIIKNTDASSYMLNKNDFYIIKDKNTIIGFGRIYKIEEWDKELSSLRIDEKYRWKKLGVMLSQQLIQDKWINWNLYLGTKKELERYYNKLWFKQAKTNIPEKLFYTLKRAEEQWLKFIIMKLN